MAFLKSLFAAKKAKVVEVQPFAARFEVPAGETVLEAALKAFNEANESVQMWEVDYSTAILVQG